jgi:membrane-associated protein
MTIIMARFLPVVRTFAPIVAGVARMSYPRFLMFNVVGGVLWGAGLPLAGYWLGSIIPEDKVDKYLIPIVLLIIIVSVLPTAFHVWKEHREDLLAMLPWRRGTAVAMEPEKSDQ